MSLTNVRLLTFDYSECEDASYMFQSTNTCIEVESPTQSRKHVINVFEPRVITNGISLLSQIMC